LEVQYEDDPLVEPFNVYLQVFLSQALEPNFLSVIKETNESFYLDALDQIDGMIDKKCKEITKLARWKLDFQEALHRCPLMKEIDRPNLKQACQASVNASPPSIKSVFLSGVPYDRFLLTEKPGSGNHAQVNYIK
ncbi:proline-rich protein 12, partial [Plakobranchus ocellatus]